MDDCGRGKMSSYLNRDSEQLFHECAFDSDIEY